MSRTWILHLWSCCSPFNDYSQVISNTFDIKGHWEEENVKVIFHVQITRVTSIYHSYFIYNIFLEWQFPGEYCLIESKQLEYKSSACIFLNIFYFKLNAFVLGFLIYMSLIYIFLCWIDVCNVTLVTFIIRISRSYDILVGTADW